METQDIIVGFFYFLFFIFIAILLRPHLTNEATKKYFLPALLARFVACILLGLLYKFYYTSGDTYNYFDSGTIVYQAFLENFDAGLKLIFFEPHFSPDIFEYSSKIPWYYSPPEYFIVRIIGLLSIFTNGSYVGVALFFAFFSFLGLWSFYSCIQSKFSHLTKWLAFGILFIPSTVIWGSGILKDTITLGSLGFLVWATFNFIENKRLSFRIIAVLIFSAGIIYNIKIYILIAFIPCAILWWYLSIMSSIRYWAIRVAMAPLLFTLFVVAGYIMLQGIAEDSYRYNLTGIPEWIKITSHDIGFWSGRNAGSMYSLGEQDGTWEGLIPLIPSAINVSLFRPYLWEVKNPLMLLAAFESFVLFILTLTVLSKLRFNQCRKMLFSPMVFTFVIFTLIFAFAMGVSTYNFGTLSRYKIPCMPFCFVAISFLSKSNRGYF